MEQIDDPRSLVSQWLARLGAAAGLSLRLDEDGVCGIGHASGIDCAIEVPEEGGSVYLRAPLIDWPPGHPGRTAEFCLEAQFLGLGTDGASLAIDPRERELVLWMAVPVSTLDAGAMESLVVRFLETAVRWRDEIERLDSAPPSPATDASPVPPVTSQAQLA